MIPNPYSSTGSFPGSPPLLLFAPKPRGSFPATDKAQRPAYVANARVILHRAAAAAGGLGMPALHRIVDGTTGWMRGLAKGLAAGAMSVASWFRASVRGLIHRHYAGALAMTKGQTPPPDVLDEVDDDTDEQIFLLLGFKKAIVEGTAPSVSTTRGIVARAGSYGSAVWATGVNALRKWMTRTKTFERRILGLVEAHCHQCPGLARLGWRPVGSLPRIGDTICREGCRCHFQYR